MLNLTENRKRKAIDDLSTNRSTVKNRKRLNNMNEFEKKLNDVKRANLVNEIYHLKKLHSSVE
jgi:hypothetical protein